MAGKADPSVLGIQVGESVYVPESFCSLVIFPASDFAPTDKMAEALEFSRDMERVKQGDLSLHSGTIQNYGSALGWAIKQAQK